LASDILLSARNDLLKVPQFTPLHSKGQKKIASPVIIPTIRRLILTQGEIIPDVVTTQPLKPRQRRFNSAVADAAQEYLQAVPWVKAEEK